MKHTSTHCHCGAHRNGSDHCPECGCEEFETVCDHVHQGTIEVVPASELQVGDVFSTDGGKVESAAKLWDGRVSVAVWMNASGGIHKHAVLDPDFPCPLWRA